MFHSTILELHTGIITYASYDDPSMEPEITEESVYGEDLDDVTPTEMFNTFASTDAAHVQNLAPTESGNTITAGVDDPADAAAAKVGEYVRITTDPYTDLKFQMEYDIQFDNFTIILYRCLYSKLKHLCRGWIDKNNSVMDC